MSMSSVRHLKHFIAILPAFSVPTAFLKTQSRIVHIKAALFHKKQL